MVKRLALLTVVLSIYGCGGGEEKSETPPPVVAEKLYINGIEVPPEPNEKINNSTISGIDTDGNGIRDDIDRRLAENFGSDKNKYEIAKRESYLLQKAIVYGDVVSIAEYDKFLNCLSDYSLLKGISEINVVLLNTDGRKRAYVEAFQGEINEIGAGCGND